MPTSPRPRQLLIGVLVLLGVVIVAIVVMAVSDATWGLLIAIVALACATLAAVVALLRIAGEERGGPIPTPARRTALGLVIAAVVVLASGATEVIASASAQDSQSAAASTAEQTVREFLTDASLDQNGYVACGLLTASEQARVAAAVGHDQVCREALAAAVPVDGVASPHGLRDLTMHAHVRGMQAVVTVAGGARPLRFELDRTTAAELAAFQPPRAPWRISSGAEALVR